MKYFKCTKCGMIIECDNGFSGSIEHLPQGNCSSGGNHEWIQKN